MNITPLHDYVLVQRKEESQKTSGGIVIPDSAAEKSNRGEVIAVGKGRALKGGKILPPSVKPGDSVLFSGYSNNSIDVGGKELLVIHEADIIAVINH